jgi:hypothetical protein
MADEGFKVLFFQGDTTLEKLVTGNLPSGIFPPEIKKNMLN